MARWKKTGWGAARAAPDLDAAGSRSRHRSHTGSRARHARCQRRRHRQPRGHGQAQTAGEGGCEQASGQGQGRCVRRHPGKVASRDGWAGGGAGCGTRNDAGDGKEGGRPGGEGRGGGVDRRTGGRAGGVDNGGGGTRTGRATAAAHARVRPAQATRACRRATHGGMGTWTDAGHASRLKSQRTSFRSRERA